MDFFDGPDFLTEMGEAWRVAERMIARGYDIALSMQSDGMFVVSFLKSEIGPPPAVALSAPHVICLAAYQVCAVDLAAQA